MYTPVNSFACVCNSLTGLPWINAHVRRLCWDIQWFKAKLTSVQSGRWNRGSSAPWCQGCASFWWCWPLLWGTSHTARWCTLRWAPSCRERTWCYGFQQIDKWMLYNSINISFGTTISVTGSTDDVYSFSDLRFGPTSFHYWFGLQILECQ